MGRPLHSLDGLSLSVQLSQSIYRSLCRRQDKPVGLLGDVPAMLEAYIGNRPRGAPNIVQTYPVLIVQWIPIDGHIGKGRLDLPLAIVLPEVNVAVAHLAGHNENELGAKCSYGILAGF